MCFKVIKIQFQFSFERKRDREKEVCGRFLKGPHGLAFHKGHMHKKKLNLKNQQKIMILLAKIFQFLSFFGKYTNFMIFLRVELYMKKWLKIQ